MKLLKTAPGEDSFIAQWKGKFLEMVWMLLLALSVWPGVFGFLYLFLYVCMLPFCSSLRMHGTPNEPGPGVCLLSTSPFQKGWNTGHLRSILLLNWKQCKMADSAMHILHSKILQLPITCSAVIIK